MGLDQPASVSISEPIRAQLFTMSETFVRRVFIASTAFLLAGFFFLYGLAVEHYRIWPYETIQSVLQAAKSIVKYGELVPEGRRVKAPANASRERVTIHRPDLIGDGYYVFVGWDSEDNRYSAWLYDNHGVRLHTWSLNYLSLDPDGPSNGADNPHPFAVLRDGSIMLGFDEGDVMARLDVCGNPIWIKDGIYHHSMSPAEDGSYWVWRGDGTAYGHFNYLENFDVATGETISEISLIEDIVRPLGSAATIFGVRPDYPFQRFDRNPADQRAVDIFHPNDVEELSSDLAPFFPMFDAGDLLLSFRTLNLVAVIDIDDHRVKWWSHGPWIGQHDPDFTSDGRISVFNNNTRRGRSEILLMDPATREIENKLFAGEASFRSDFMGKHQYLPNGNVLVVVPGEGRILEFTEYGKNVMEFNNLSVTSVEYNEHVENGLWLPPDYFLSVPECSQ